MIRKRDGVLLALTAPALMMLGVCSATAWSVEAKPDAAPLVVNLKAAVDRALSRLPEVQSAREKIREGEANTKLAYSYLFPSIGTDFTYQHRKDPLNIGSPAFGGESYNLYDFKFTLNQPLFSGGALFAGISVAKDEQKLLNFNLREVERDTTLKVIQTFYDVMLNEGRLHTLLEQQDALNEHLKLAEARYRTGRTRKLDVLQIQTQRALLLPQIQDARNKYQISGAQLANLLGDREASEIEVEGTLKAPDWQSIRKDHMGKEEAIPEIQANALAQEENHSKKTVTLAKNYPQVFASGYWGRSSYVKSDLLNEFSTNWSVGLTLQIPLFSGLSYLYESRAIASQQSQLEIEETRLRDHFALQQVESQKAVVLAISQIDASASALKIATEAIHLARREFGLGMADYLQLFDAEQQYVSAEFDFDQARHDAIVAEAQAYVARGWHLGDLVQRLVSEGQ